MKLLSFIAAVTAMSFICAGNVNAGDDVDNLISKGLTEIGAKEGDSSLCVITNASYVIRAGQTTERYIDSIKDITGCTPGKNNLFLFHSPETDNLRIALFDKTSFKCVLIAFDNDNAFITGPLSVSFESLGDSTLWNNIQEKLGQKDSFTIVAMAHHWAAGAPYDFMKCAEIHNHLCAGITSGYLIAKYIMKFYPLGIDESYTYISCPPWCKDDGIQTLLDLTPGKKNMFVKSLSEGQLKQISNPDAAGIFLIRKKGVPIVNALIISYEQREANKLNGSLNYKGLQASLKMLTGMIPYYSKPELFVRVIKKTEISSDTADSLTYAGVNPYVVLDFLK